MLETTPALPSALGPAPGIAGKGRAPAPAPSVNTNGDSLMDGGETKAVAVHMLIRGVASKNQGDLVRPHPPSALPASYSPSQHYGCFLEYLAFL